MKDLLTAKLATDKAAEAVLSTDMKHELHFQLQTIISIREMIEVAYFVIQKQEGTFLDEENFSYEYYKIGFFDDQNDEVYSKRSENFYLIFPQDSKFQIVIKNAPYKKVCH